MSHVPYIVIAATIATASHDAGWRLARRPPMSDVADLGSELALTVRGYEVTVRIPPDGALRITCPPAATVPHEPHHHRGHRPHQG